ncbi:MAG: aldehyde dehydrogenase family protein, partial [Turicibacter sp.]
VNSALLDLPFDYIFFTGSVRVGKIVMEKASHYLTPITLELGGKSPVIIDETANLKIAANRVAWGKFSNAGQTCVAPDYALVHEKVYDAFVDQLKSTIQVFYGSDIKNSSDFGRIVSDHHMNRLVQILEHDQAKIIFGGEIEAGSRYIAPTLLTDVTLDDRVMEDELFGPILPLIKYKTYEDIQYHLKAHPKPLALYVFSENKTFSEKIITNFSFGGGCVNDTITHVASSVLPFGGVGPSGMGQYHGKYSFETFTYAKSIVKRSTKLNLSLVFPPYKDKVKLIRKIMK